MNLVCVEIANKTNACFQPGDGECETMTKFCNCEIQIHSIQESMTPAV